MADYSEVNEDRNPTVSTPARIKQADEKVDSYMNLLPSSSLPTTLFAPKKIRIYPSVMETQ